MKKTVLIFGLFALFFAFSCGGGSNDNSNSKSEKSGIYEPNTQEEFESILSEMGVKPYPGAVVTGFLNNADATMKYKVPSEGNTNKSIIEYYGTEFEKVFSGKEDWKNFMSSSISLSYMKGFDLTFGLIITSENAASEAQGAPDDESKPDSLSYTMMLGDGAVSY